MVKYLFFFFLTKVLLAKGGLIDSFRQSQLEVEVHPALIAFRFKNDQSPLWGKATYLNGTISRLGGWHKPNEIFSFLASYFQIKEKNYPLSQPSNLYNIGIYELTEAKLSRKLYCCRSQKNNEGFSLLLDFCFLPVKTQDYQDFLQNLLHAFAQNEIWPKEFTDDIIIFQNQNRFTMPPLWLLRYQNEERAYFTDAAGFAELEIYLEKLKATELESATLDIWEKSMIQKLTKEAKHKKISQAQASCLIMENLEKQLNLCYTLRGNIRIVMLSSFPIKLYDGEALLAWQLATLKKWALG